MNYDSADEKLKHAISLFEDAVDHTVDAHSEAHRAERFYHNTECEGQWEADDLRYLRDQLRPAFSFNIVKSKLDTFLGMYADAQRTPVVAAAGSDELLADVLNAVKDQVLQDAKYDRLSARMLKTGTITGECAMHIEVVPSDENPDWIQINLYRILPFELHWDISSVEPDRCDAKYVFWDRWLSKPEFKHAYPEHADEWNIFSVAGEPHYKDSDDDSTWSEPASSQPWEGDDDYSNDRWNRYYYDRQKGKLRVIRYEYYTRKTFYQMHDMATGQKQEIEKDQVKHVEQLQKLGHTVEVIEEDREVVEVCEFVGRKLLAEYEEAGSFKGFSIIPYCYDVDEETGTAYGLIRNLFDPQMELNKSKSLEIEYMAQSTAPGVIAEEGAIKDEDQFSDEMRRAGGVSIAAKGALAEGRLMDRTPTPPSAALMNRMTGAMNLLNEVSTIPSAANLTASEHAQAGVTVAIRYHKSKQAVSSPFAHYEDSQKVLVGKVCEVIVNEMPDDQIQAILGKSNQYRIENGQVIEMAMGDQGQMEPKDTAQLREVRHLPYSLDMEYTSENSTLRMLELDMLMQLVQSGVDVDPEVLVERATNSRVTQEKLKAYVEEARKAKSAGAEAQSKALEQQNQQFMMVEGAKVKEQTRHNMATERLDMSDQQIEERLKLLTLWEKADEAEKDRLLDMARFAVQQANTTEVRVNG